MSPPLRVVAAMVPGSVAGSAVRVAFRLTAALRGRLTVFALREDLGAGERATARDPAGEQAMEWVREMSGGQRPDGLVVGGGLAGIEIPRFAESVQADLLVLPRMSHGGERLADAVTRRSRVPCLAVPVGHEQLDRWLVALDGTPRCTTALAVVAPLVGALGASAVVVTVEPAGSWRAGTGDSHLARTLELARALEDGGAGASGSTSAVLSTPLRVRHGDIVTEVLLEQEALQAGVLAIGARPGGPPPPIPEGSLARRLLNDAPCMVLTVPF